MPVCSWMGGTTLSDGSPPQGRRRVRRPKHRLRRVVLPPDVNDLHHDRPRAGHHDSRARRLPYVSARKLLRNDVQQTRRRDANH